MPQQDIPKPSEEVSTEPISEEDEPEQSDSEEPQADDKEEPKLDDKEPKADESERPQAKEPNLEIAKGDDGKYIVQIGIFRMTTLDDGVGELAEEGMAFTATDAAGNPISGMITVEGETATVTFTDSTWEYLENGSSFKYTKSSDIPNVWSE